MRNYEGFEAKDKRAALPPVPDYDHVAPTHDRLLQLLGELKRSRLSPRAVGMVMRLAGMTSVIRLVVNLKVTFGLMAQGEIVNILVEGLTDDERKVLLEVGGSSLSSQAKETAHALFNLEARLTAITHLAGGFRKARTTRGQDLSGDEINNIMES